MRGTDLHAQILGVREPWNVTNVQLDLPHQRVEVTLSLRLDAVLRCPECDAVRTQYDSRIRWCATWTRAGSRRC